MVNKKIYLGDCFDKIKPETSLPLQGTRLRLSVMRSKWHHYSIISEDAVNGIDPRHAIIHLRYL